MAELMGFPQGEGVKNEGEPRWVDTNSDEVVSLWKEEGRIYQRKIEPIRGARQVADPETVVTIIPGGVTESTTDAKPGDWVITGAQGEEFVFTNSKFEGLYTSDEEGVYMPRERRVVAIPNPYNKPISVTAPWSTPDKPELQNGDANCRLVASLDDQGELTNDRYIIGSEELLLSNYEIVSLEPTP